MKKISVSCLILAAILDLGLALASSRTKIMFDAFDVAAGTFVYCDVASPPTGVTCTTGAAADDGWLQVRGMDAKRIIIRPDIVSLAAGTIEVTIEARTTDSDGNFATETSIAPINYAAAQAGQGVRIVENVEQIRVGLRINGADDGVPDSVTVHYDGGQ